MIARRIDPKWGGGSLHLLLPAFLLLGLLLIFPLLVSLWTSFAPSSIVRDSGSLWFGSNYSYLFRREFYVSVFIHTFKLAAYVVLLSFLLGYSTATALRKVYSRRGSTLVLGLTFPILVGPLGVVIGWMILMTRNGPINQLLMVTGLAQAPLQLIGTEAAVIIAMTQFNLPFVVLNILNSLLTIDPHIEEAASGLGANPARVFWHITWPLSLPGVFAALMISFSLAISAFVAPHYLDRGNLVVTTLIQHFMFTTFETNMASAVGILLVLISVVIMLIYGTILSGRIARRFGSIS